MINRTLLAAAASLAIITTGPAVAQTSGPTVAPSSGETPVVPDATGATPSPATPDAPGGNEAASSAGNAGDAANTTPPIGSAEQEPADPEDEDAQAPAADMPVPTTAPAQSN